MNIEVEKLAKSEAKLTIELTAEEMKQYEEKATQELQEHVNVPGFRKGHVPVEVLKDHVGEQAFMAQVLDHAIGVSYEAAVRSKELRPVAYPKIQILKDQPLKYEALVALRPEVSFKKDPKNLSVKMAKMEVNEKEVKEVIDNFLERFKNWKDVTRAAKKGDRVEIDFDGLDEDGVALEGTSSKNHPVILGSGSLIPGFEEEVESMEIGEEKDFWITFPKDYHKASFQDKKVKFHIKLNRVEESEAATADDAWAKQVSGDPEKTLETMKKDIHAELIVQKQMQEEGRLENDFLKQLAEHVEAEVPEALVEREIDLMVERIKEDVEKRKESWEAYQENLKKEGKDLRTELRTTAAEQVLVRLGLEKLFELENPEVSEEEVEQEVEKILGRYPEQFREMLRGRYAAGTEEREYMKQTARFKKLVRGHTQK
ncbi:trigger factor [Candidatus Peregrinibacteria bacterium]|nr:MAG: trigger factor [Candidatus Peregrinibacteria bacterium]